MLRSFRDEHGRSHGLIRAACIGALALAVLAVARVALSDSWSTSPSAAASAPVRSWKESRKDAPATASASSPRLLLNPHFGPTAERHLRAEFLAASDAVNVGREQRDRTLAAHGLAVTFPRIVLVSFEVSKIAHARESLADAGATALQFVPEASWITRVPTLAAQQQVERVPGVIQVAAMPAQWKSPLSTNHVRDRMLKTIGTPNDVLPFIRAQAASASDAAAVAVELQQYLNQIKEESTKSQHAGLRLCSQDAGAACDSVPCAELHQQDSIHVSLGGDTVYIQAANASHFAACPHVLESLADRLAQSPMIVWVDVSSANIKRMNAFSRHSTQSTDVKGWMSAPAEFGVCSLPSCAPQAEGFYPFVPGQNATTRQALCDPGCHSAACDWGFMSCGFDMGSSILSTTGLTGASQVVHVADTGLDVTHPMFYDSNVNISALHDYRNATLSNHRKVALYFAASDGSDGTGGHGTHVCGSVAGSPPACAAYNGLRKFSGMAQGARIIISDVYCSTRTPTSQQCKCPPVFQDAGGCTACAPGQICPASIPLNQPIIADAGYLHGARISSNSWGYFPVLPMYDATAAAWDEYLFRRDDYLLIFAAANEGSGAPDAPYRFATVSQPASAKNVLAVGALEGSAARRLHLVSEFWDPSDRASCAGMLTEYSAGLSAPVCSSYTCAHLLFAESFQTGSETGLNLALCCGCTAERLLQDAVAMHASPSQMSYIGAVTQALQFSGRRRADFSSLGPTLDGRIKPDIMAPGEMILSARSAGGAYDTNTTCAFPLTIQVEGDHWPAQENITLRGFGIPVHAGSPMQHYVTWYTAAVGLRTPVRLSRFELFVAEAVVGTDVAVVVAVTHGNSFRDVVKSSPLLVQTYARAGYMDFGPIDMTAPPGSSILIMIFATAGANIIISAAPQDELSFMPSCFGEIVSDTKARFTFDTPDQARAWLTEMSGTSMAAPTVSGLAGLVREYFTSGFYPTGAATPAYGFSPSAALLRAVIINSASGITEPFQGNVAYRRYLNITYSWSEIAAASGFGSVNLIRGLSFSALGGSTRENGLPTLLLPGLKLQPVVSVASGQPALPATPWRGADPAVAHGEVMQFCIDVPARNISAGTPLSLTLAWTDPPGSPLALYALVNNLDLEVVTPAGRLLRGNNLVNSSVQLPDGRNNVEKLEIPGPAGTIGGSGTRLSHPYSVLVRGAFVPAGPQAFSLVITGPGILFTAGRAPGTCGALPVDSALDSELADLRSQKSNLTIAVIGLAIVLGVVVAAAGFALGRYRRSNIAVPSSTPSPPSRNGMIRLE